MSKNNDEEQEQEADDNAADNTNDNTNDSTKTLNTGQLIAISLFGTGIQAPLLFLPANNWLWIEAWIYLLFFLVFLLILTILLNKKNPEILQNRMKSKKEGFSKPSGSDKFIMPLISSGFILTYIIPAFDERYGWSGDSLIIMVFGFILLVISFYLLYQVMLQNAYASKVLDIRKDSGHKLIDTGYYAKVRHPMYSAFSLMFIAIPLAFNCLWALIPAFMTVSMLILRIKYEEEMLIQGLNGYREYKERVKYKIIPKIY
ncbi:MAG: hypothetical protein GF364_08235 [Candidatus Lokiarchaeota archaeon]|nr:hypothetical protein [Candidatus Lokiarchaeota archaeon]